MPATDSDPMKPSKKPISTGQKLAVSIIAVTWLVLLPTAGILRRPDDACSFCVAAMAHHHFALLGYIYLGGWLLSLTQPTESCARLNERSDRGMEPPLVAYREDVQGYTFFIGSLVSLMWFLGSVEWDLVW